jgi:hypothetical protein
MPLRTMFATPGQADHPTERSAAHQRRPAPGSMTPTMIVIHRQV